MNRQLLWSMAIATIASSTLVATQSNAQSVDPMVNLTDGILKQRATESESCITAPKSTRCLTFRAWHRKWEFDARSRAVKTKLTTDRCESGDPFSCYLRGVLELQYSTTNRQAIPWFKQACNQGNAYGCMGLARLSAIDEASRKQAKKILDQACAQGFPEGCVSRLKLTQEPSDPKTSGDQSLTVWLEACESQMLGACERAGFRFIRGQGVQKDIKRGKALVDRACNGGFFRSCVALGLNYQEDTFGEPDLEAASSYYQKACDDEFIWGCSLLGNLKINRPSLTEKQEAEQLHQKACDRGSALSCGTLGLIYLLGWTGVRDESRGISLLSGACEKGNASDCTLLGEYFLGIGTGSINDLVKSAAFFTKACALGKQEGCNRQGP